MRQLLLVVVPLALSSIVACGDDSSGTDGGATDAGRDTGGTVDSGGGVDAAMDSGTFVPGGERYTLDWGPVTAAAGEEDTRCIVARLGNPEQVRIGQIINDLGPASHHMIVYRTNDTEERLTPFACDPFLDTLDPTAGSPLTVSQRAEETITLPDGVGYTLEANQMIRLELHFLNTTPEEVEVHATTTFVSIAPETFEHEADFLFIGNPDIDIPARSAATLGPTFFPLPRELEGVSFYSITGHTHQWGTDVTVEVADSEGGTGTSVYDVPNWQWEEPETTYHDPPFEVPSGGGFRFTCEWQNDSDRNVGFGESATSEMCFFWAYYYPSRGAKVCIHTEQAGGHDVCCPGDALCSLVEGIL